MGESDTIVQSDTIEVAKIELKDNSKRSQLAINIFWCICIINLITVISGYYELDLLQRANNGEMLTDEEVSTNDLRHLIIEGFQSVLYIASIILFLNWFRRAYGNLHRIRIKNLEHSEAMAVWSFFIPIISLYRPYQIAKEIVIKTRNEINKRIPYYSNKANLSIVGFWWTLFLITNFIGQYARRTMFKEETIDQLITSTQAYMVLDFLDIPAAIVTLLMIKQIGKEETLLFEKINDPDADTIL